MDDRVPCHKRWGNPFTFNFELGEAVWWFEVRFGVGLRPAARVQIKVLM